MKFYDFEEIKSAADCVAFAKDIFGAKINGTGRCAAVWRGGDSTDSVHIKQTEWYDHVQKIGGGIIELAALKFDGNKQQAQQFLGEYYNLTPKRGLGKQPGPDCRYESLLRQGYEEVARYNYNDTNGAIRHFTIRMQHTDFPGKEFVQGRFTDNNEIRWSLKGTDTILYRLNLITASPWVLVCEGEKAADKLAKIDIPTTSAPMGAGKWCDAYSESLRGKTVIIAPDNDEPGHQHAITICKALEGISKASRIITPDPTLPEKAGIDDWLAEDETRDQMSILDLIKDAEEYHSVSAADAINTTEVSEEILSIAKSANEIPFRNYIPSETTSTKNGRTKKEINKEPRTHSMMLEDLSRRMLSFPRKVGDNYLFDHDRDSDAILHIKDSDDLLSWISRRSKRNVDFARADSTVAPRQFMASIRAECRRYEAISSTPDYPRRDDIYYSHGKIPDPCPLQSRFWGFVDYFLPATPEDRCLLAAFACAPLWYIPGVDRPSWVIDSVDGQGSGKTNLAELVADLYGHAPISTSKQELATKVDVLVKRCVSKTGREARIMLVDNVTGNFISPELADLVTRKDISGIPPYGRGEEVRPNNLTFVITSNSANVDSDIADRSFYIHLKKPEADAPGRSTWKERVQAYIRKHRLEIMSDMIDMIKNHEPFSVDPRTRFAAFETTILQPVCHEVAAYERVCESLKEAKEESNIEQDQARLIIDMFKWQLERNSMCDSDKPVFVSSELCNSWGRLAIKDSYDYKGKPIQLMRNLCKAGFMPMMDKNILRWPRTSKEDRRSGVAWNFEPDTKSCLMIFKKGEDGIGQVLT